MGTHIVIAWANSHQLPKPSKSACKDGNMRFNNGNSEINEPNSYTETPKEDPTAKMFL